MKLSYHNYNIQKLRGMAIFFVLLFHFYPSFFSIGYLGVDIFFVISGYLITNIIFKNDKFSFLDFYLNRLKRIIPPILVILFFSSVFSLFLFLPVDSYDFWKSLLSVIFFVPNFFFLITGGYFGGINELKPLLHTWSLGIELQYYFLFPIIVLSIRKLLKLNYVITIFFLFIISFSFNYFLLINNYSNISFFLLFSRFWQFCAGSLIFFIPKFKISNNYKTVINFIFILIIFAIVFLNINYSNLLNQSIITFSVCVILYFSNNSNKIIFFYEKFFLFLGNISYSTYLIHWPFLVFIKYYLVRDLTHIETFFILIISILISYFFFIKVENYFRYKVSIFQFIKFTIMFLALIFLIYFLKINIRNFYFSNNEAIILSNSINTNYRCNFKNISFDNTSRSCQLNFSKKNNFDEIIILGNSHAQMYGYPVEKILKNNNLNALIIPANSCLPTILSNISPACIDIAEENLNRILKKNNVRLVLIGLDWDHKFLFDRYGVKKGNNQNIELVRAVYDLIEIFEKNKINTILIGPISTPDYNFASIESRLLFFKKNSDFRNYKETKTEFENRYNQTFDFFEKKKYFNIIKPHQKQCTSGVCVFSINNESLFSDHVHLSRYGSLIFEDKFLKILDFFKN